MQDQSTTASQSEFKPLTPFGKALKAAWRLRRIFEETITWKFRDVYYPTTVVADGRCLIADSWIRDSDTFVLLGLLGKSEFSKWSIPFEFELLVHTDYVALIRCNAVLDTVQMTHSQTTHAVKPNLHIEQCPPHKHLMAATTCRDDYRLLTKWTAYHSRIGIAFFAIYYNGRVPIHLKRIMNRLGNQGKLIQWNIPYYVPNTHDDRPFWNHGQMIQMVHSLWFFGKPCFDWIANFDLDEYLVVDQPGLLNLLEATETALVFPNIWQYDSNQAITRSDYHHRAKQISKTSKFSSFWVHQTINENGEDLTVVPNCYLLHRFRLGAPWRMLNGRVVPLKDEVKAAFSYD